MQAEDRDAYVADDAAIAAALRDDEAILDVYQEAGGAKTSRIASSSCNAEAIAASSVT